MKDPHDAGHRTDEEGTARIDATALFRAHAAFVARFVVQIGVPPRDRDDIVQEVFLVAHRQGGFTPGEAKPTTWLARIALRVASNYRRSKRRKPEDYEEGVVAALRGPDGERDAEDREALRRVARALEALDEEKRAAFVLYELQGMGASDIAESLDVPVGTVYSRLHHARAAFMKAFQRSGGGDE